MNWNTLARDVVEEWAGRTMQLRAFLGNASADASVNATETILAVRRLAYSPLNPYMDTTSAPDSTAWTSFFEASPMSAGWSVPFVTLGTNTSALERCKYAATTVTHRSGVRLTPQEELLRVSVETVLSRLCSDYGSMFVESMEADEHAPIDSIKALIAGWEDRVVALMEWLDWTEWLRCDQVCASDSVCSMPLWPVSMWMGLGGGMPRRPGGGRDDSDNPEVWKPRCVPFRVQQFGWPPRRNADLELLLAARHVL
ncbi:hypothetical protein EVJ58_g9898 [Rhodofomes roseus]|uniref:Uncharacterized protein n=1 Tax=Rhodofomes roseus TaxID=34475 RepID=A0A4Y9XVS2_9APHY|nr:hypothetical protein EVJ58_g9898 [Rhodofomes roseus]